MTPATIPSEGSAVQMAARVVQAKARSRRAILVFVALTFGWTWGLWLLSALVKPHAPMASNSLFLASAFGPGLSAVIVTLFYTGRAGLGQWLGHCLRWRVGWRWYALAFAVPSIILLLAIVVHAALGGAIPDSPYAGRVLIAIAQFAVIAIFGGPLGEEFGWRGYALPALTVQMGWRSAGVVTGILWGFWHTPLLFMAGTAQADLPVALFLISTVGLAVVFARLGVVTRFSVLPALLLHSVINWWSMIVPIMPAGGDMGAYALVAGITAENTWRDRPRSGARR